MKCDRCDKEAIVEISIIAGEVHTKLNLCEDHYLEFLSAQMPEGVDKDKSFTYFQEILADLVSGVIDSNSMDHGAQEPCPQCHKTFEQVIESGRFGCDRCYTHFDELTKTTLAQTQGAVSHTGKSPARYEGVRMLQAVIDETKEKLEFSIQEERYEDAAEIRDEMSELNERLNVMRGEIDG